MDTNSTNSEIERLRAENADLRNKASNLQKEIYDLRMVFDHSPIMMFFKDDQNTILRANKLAASTSGRSSESLVGARTADIYPDLADKYHRDDLEVIRSGEPKLGIVEKLDTKNGETIWVKTDKIPWRDNQNNVNGVVVFVEDISDLKKAEIVAMNANQAKTEHLSTVSHEIRTPLTSILGFADLLSKDNSLNPALHKKAEIIARNSRMVLTIVEDILDIAKIDAGIFRITKSIFPLRELAEDMTELLRTNASSKKIDFNVLKTGAYDISVHSDNSRIKQILSNLIVNAVKYTEAGSVTLSIDIIPKQGDFHELSFEVKDSGRGIKASDQERIFEPFVRLSPESSKLDTDGAGLGLALSYKLAKELGGKLYLKSSIPGQGSTFVFSVVVPSCDKLIIRHHNSRTADKLLSKVRVLLVEDNRDIQELYREILTSAGASVALASDGELALTSIQNRPFDLILMDIQMPKMDGYETTRRIRNLGFKNPIAALTAKIEKDEARRCELAGCDLYLSKLMDPESFLKSVGSLVSNDQSSSQSAFI